MSEDASLEAFAESDRAGDDESAATADPAVSTFAWSPDGGACAACGESVRRRWRDGDGLVCADCKEW